MTMLDSPDFSAPRYDFAETRARAVKATKHGAAAVMLLADPRGRCNRQAFLYIALAFLALQTGVACLLWLLDLEVTRSASLAMNAPVLWIGTTICIKRLHDVGRRGWWLPGAFVLWVVVALIVTTIISMLLPPEAMEAGQPIFFAVLIGITLPAFAALIWLHTAPSAPSLNAFGPVPVGFGISMPAKSRRTRPVHVYYADGVMA